jgi:hypothetical protein
VRATLGPLDAAGRVPAFQQGRVASFLISAHAAEARLLAAALAGPIASAEFGPRQIELHDQLSRELGLLSLLVRVTSWLPDPLLMWSLWQWEIAWLPQPVEGIPGFAEGLAIDAAAFGYALHTAVRPATFLPQDIPAMDPFAAALRRIETEGGRIVQAQLRFLKSPELAPMRDAISEAVERRHHQLRRLWAELLSSMDIHPIS